MSLSPRQRTELIEALRHAFEPDDFDMMLLTRLSKKRSDIVEDKGFEITVFEVVKDSEQKGWTRELIHAVLKERGGNERLQNFARDFPEYDPSAPLVNAHILYVAASPGEGPLTSSPSDLIQAEVLKRQAGGAEEIVFKPRAGGAVVMAFGDFAALLKFATHISTTIKAPDAERLRLGLHTVACGAGTSGPGTPKVPAEGVEVARRVAELGSAGHILVTEEAAHLLAGRSDFESLFGADFDSLFREPLPCELRPSRQSFVYNFYHKHLDADGQRIGFGNDAAIPRTRAPEQVIKDFFVPPVMRVMRKEQIKVIFCPEVSYFVIVQFTFKGVSRDDLNFECEKPEGADCTFKFNFEDPAEEREHLIGLQVINAEKDQNFSVRMACLDRRGEQIILPRERPVKLRRSFLRWLWELIFQWLRETFWPSPWYVKAIPVAALALTAVLCYMLFTPPPPPPPPPPEFTANWTDDFNAEEIRNLSSRWDFVEGQVVPVNGEEVRVESGQEGPKVGAILVKRPGMVLAKVDESKKLYKFTVRFKIRFVEGEKAKWVFRAQGDKRGGYVFILYKSGNDLLMSGYKAPNPENKFDNKVRRVPVQCCHPNDAFIITATTDGGTIRHTVRVVNTTALRAGVNTPEPYPLAEFTDENNIYPSGDAGFLGSDDSQMKVEFWYLNPPGVSAASSRSPFPLRATASLSGSSPHRIP